MHLVLGQVSHDVKVFGLLGWVMFCLPLFLYVLLLRMETSLGSDSLRITFGLAGFIRRTIPLQGMTLKGHIIFRPIRDFGGYGIRCNGKQWCYNSRGNEGLRLKPAKGLEVIVGSQRYADFEKTLRKTLKS